jgi:hypothetical protein
MKRVKWQNIIIVVVVLCVTFIIACERRANIEQTNQPKAEEKTSTSPSTTPPLTEKTPDVEVTEMTEKELHDSKYKSNLRIISVFNELTKLDRVYLGKIISDKEEEIRKKNTFNLIDSLGRDARDLITLATMCRVFKGSNAQDNDMFAAPIYDIAFLYSVKVVAIEYRDNERTMRELRALKNYIGDGHLYGDFLLALDGKDPAFLYGREPDPIELERIKRENQIQ